MGLGLGITLIVIGAVLALTDLDEQYLTNLDTVGWILLAAVVLSIVVGLIMNQQNNTRRTYVEERRDIDARNVRRDV